jgi:predicted ABC-type ATPase
VYIIAGPNGAGKTTFARTFLPEEVRCLQFVNADLIASGLSPFDPAAAAVRAGRLMLGEIERLMKDGTDFAFETTLAGRSWSLWFERLKEQGFGINLFYLWLSSPDLAVARVAERVRHGGHDVPEDVIRRRFNRSLQNLFGLYAPSADCLALFSTRAARPVRLASLEGEGFNIGSFALSLFAKGTKPMPAMSEEVPLPLDEQAERALRKAAAKLLHERTTKGDTVCVERNGKVEHVPASQILAEHPEIEEVLKHGRNDGQ